jgi:ribosomal protein S18 acetylase RimI-like enzyme
MTSEFAPLLRLGKFHIQSAADTLAHAFQNYPVYTYYYPDPVRRNRVIQYCSSAIVHFCIRFGEVYATSPNFEGVAVWVHSKYYHMSLWNSLRAVPLSVLIGAGLSGASRMRPMDFYVDSVHMRLIPSNHWYLLYLGVDPRFQGRGYASKLVRPMLVRTDQEKIPCYLETQDEADVPIYLHFGFKTIEKGIIHDTTINNWAMLREAGGWVD